MRLLFFKDRFCGVLSINTCSEKNSLNLPPRKSHLLILSAGRVYMQRRHRRRGHGHEHFREEEEHEPVSK